MSGDEVDFYLEISEGSGSTGKNLAVERNKVYIFVDYDSVYDAYTLRSAILYARLRQG